jgi:hypothetical protein
MEKEESGNGMIGYALFAIIIGLVYWAMAFFWLP